ncbi:MAG: hypothetical protein RQ867_10555 [Mariprofundaceae bacterium]|nr:hypothetical protein [Mariprofundaceae bacterium]
MLDSRYLTVSMVLAGILLAGCAGITPPPAHDTELMECRQLFRNVDTAVAAAGVQDHGPYPLTGFPYLRINRFYASFRDELDDADRFDAWAGRLAALDAEARRIELQNLPAAEATRFANDVSERLERCRERLLTADLDTPEERTRLRRQARVPDDYLIGRRALGLYPLTALFIAAGISLLHEESRQTFATPLAELPLAGTLQRRAPPRGDPLASAEVRAILQRSLDPLGIPVPTATELGRLFDTFAPVWEVDVVDGNDRIGMPAWDNGRLLVDTAHPTLFRKLSYTRFHGRVLLQLNYIVWFPARSGNDIYAGQFDGINWRVTLGPDGTPWLYDAMHNCGCYHKFFPSRQLRLRRDLSGLYFETPLLPQLAPADGPLILRIAHRTHYIQRLYRGGQMPSTQLMAWQDYDLLRSLPADHGHRSMFGAAGIVPGSQRPERFILWPTGVRSPGAMRQWGRHATAFVGRRHFDDPGLIEALFEQAGP